MQQTEQQFLNALESKLWAAANKLLPMLDAANYKHVVLGLIFIKYVSDAFKIRRDELIKQFKNTDHDYYLEPDDYSPEEYEKEILAELEIRDYYTEKNVFWVPALSRWETLQKYCKVTPGTEIEITNGEKTIYKFSSVGRLIDDALDAIEKDNPKLKGILNKNYARLQIDQSRLGELIDLIATIPFHHETLGAKDILGHVYEYFLGQFALAEGKKGGQFYTPKSIVSLIVEMLQPFKGRVYDPAMGSGGFFVQSEKFIKDHKGALGNVSIYGQEYNHTTWQLAAMNMVIRGMDFNFGKEPADTFTNDRHPDLKADFVMANPPFNMKDWWNARLEGDPRWQYGTPPPGNANFAWMQHMIYHLNPNGSMALLLANGSMSSNTSGEGDIRRNLVEADLVECMVALPGQLFTNTQIPACIWFLTRNKNEGAIKRERRSEVLFIDARKLGYMKDRVLRDFDPMDIKRVAEKFHDWQSAVRSKPNETEDKGQYEDEPGFCKSVKLEEIRKNDYVLTPGRYVDTEDEEDDGEPFAEKMTKLSSKLYGQFNESDQLIATIKQNLQGLGYDE
ncbi:MAG: type I restriction-modification system subunit M [Calditrichaceae bacterium]